MSLNIYISGPISKGDYLSNVRAAVDAAQAIRAVGLFPYVPHLSTMWAYSYRRDHADWMKQAIHWLGLCQAMLRLPGDSDGADEEEKYATTKGIPVFRSLEDLFAWAKAR